MRLVFKIYGLLSAADRMKYAFVLGIRVLLVGLDLAGVACMGLTMSLITNVAVSETSLTFKVIDLFNNIGFTNVALAVAGLSASFFMVKGIASVTLNRVVGRFVARIEYEQASKRFQGFITSGLEPLSKYGEKDFIHALTGSSNMAFSQSLLAFSVVFGEALLLIGLAVFLMLTNLFMFAILATFFTLFGLSLSRLVNHRTRKFSQSLEESSLATTSHILDSVHVMREVQIGGLSGGFQQRFLQHKKAQALATSEMMLLGFMPRYLTEIALMVGLAFIIFLRSVGLLQEFSPAQMAIFAGGAFRLIASMLPLQAAFSTLQRCRVESRLVMALPLPGEGDSKPSVAPPKSWEIEFRHVYFRYEKADVPVLNDASVSIGQGAKIAITGKSGAGKSTFADLLMGLRSPQSGQLLIGGLDSRAFIQEFPGAVAYMPQRTSLVDGTLLENISLDFTGQADQALRTKCEYLINRVGLEGLLSDLPQGLDTPIGGTNMQLSGGQIQRIGICRALLHSPKILLIDEGTSALDKHAELDVLTLISELDSSITAILIAHSKTVLSAVDNVLHLDNALLSIKPASEVQEDEL